MNPDRFSKRLAWDELDVRYLQALVLAARDEDLNGAGLRTLPERPGDATSALSRADATGSANIVAREPLVLCGIRMIPLILRAYDVDADPLLQRHDGENLQPGDVLATISGPAINLLQAERPLLNFLQRLSGIATETRRYVNAIGLSPTRLLDTRKTTPGWRMLEKYAVACGGAWNHRLGLFDRIMLKDNHLAAFGATCGDRLAAAVRHAIQSRPDLIVEVEVDSIDQIPPVLDAGAHVILLDNFTHADLARAVNIIGSRVCTEASGGVTLNAIPSLAQIGLDFISTGALIHQSSWTDIGLDWCA